MGYLVHLKWTLSALLLFNTMECPKAKSDFREYCIQEEFEATCEEDEVIVIEEGRYGRMSIGRCVSADYGNLGCSADVTNFMDTKCSGRHHCVMNVKELIDVAQPCDKDFSSYLEVKHQCIKVAIGTPEVCREDGHVTLESQTGYLSTLMTEETGYGMDGCPWRIKAHSGQKVELSVMDFNLLAHFKAEDDAYVEDYLGWCPVSIVVKEKDMIMKEVALCNGGQRHRHLYLSVTNEIFVHFKTHHQQNPHYYYLVQYKASGCPDVEPPKDSWMVKAGDSVRVQCNISGEVWYLTCKDGNWMGDLGNCSGVPVSRKDHLTGDKNAYPIDLVLAIVIGVVLGIVVGLCLLGAVFLIRRSFRNEPSPSPKHPLTQLDTRQVYTSPDDRHHNIINEAGDTRLCLIRESDYTYQPQRVVCRGTLRTDKDAVKKVECPIPPTDPSTHHLLTCRGHVYETTFQPEQPQQQTVTGVPISAVYHDLEQDVEGGRNRTAC